MDSEILAAYNKQAASCSRDWREQDAPSHMYALLMQNFRPGLTVDIGCGAGRDTARLAANGFEAIGVDVSQGLLDEARATYPGITFQQTCLPDLDGLQRRAYQNVRCETVIMHLEPASISEAFSSLIALLIPGGTLYLSWRFTEQASLRDKSGQLYSVFERELVTVPASGQCDVVFEEDVISTSSGKRTQRLIFRKITASAVTHWQSCCRIFIRNNDNC